MIEQSNGKARPTLPRSSDLAEVDSVPDRSAGRDASGRFAAGNRESEGQRWKASIKRLLGRGSTNALAEGVARQAFRLYVALIRELPSSGPSVRTLAALQARHAALAAYFTDRAGDLGFESDAGAKALDLALKHGQRAERLAVTTLDVSTALAKANKDRDPGAAHRAVLEAFGAPAASPSTARSTLGTTTASSESPVAFKPPSRASNGHSQGGAS